MKNEVRREKFKIECIQDTLLRAKTKSDVLELVKKWQGTIYSTYDACNGTGGWTKSLIRGEIVFGALSEYEENMGRIIYRSKGSLYFSGCEPEIPSFKLPQDVVDLIMEVF